MKKYEQLQGGYLFPSKDTPNGSGNCTHSALYIGLAIKCLCEILIDIKEAIILNRFSK